MTKNKTELFKKDSTNFVLSVCNDNFTLKISFNAISDELFKIHKKYFKKRKFKNKEITPLVIYALIKSAKEKLKFLYYWDLEEIIRNLIFKAKLEIQTSIDFLDNYFTKEINEVYFEANPGLKEFDKLVRTYFELSRLKKSGLDVNKFLEDTDNQLSSYPKELYFKSPYFCDLLTELIIQKEDK